METELVRYHTSQGIKPAIIQEGQRWIHAVLIDHPVHVVKISRQERRFMRPMVRKGEPYPLKRAVSKFRRAARTHGITKGARAILNAVR